MNTRENSFRIFRQLVEKRALLHQQAVGLLPVPRHTRDPGREQQHQEEEDRTGHFPHLHGGSQHGHQGRGRQKTRIGIRAGVEFGGEHNEGHHQHGGDSQRWTAPRNGAVEPNQTGDSDQAQEHPDVHPTGIAENSAHPWRTFSIGVTHMAGDSAPLSIDA
ncbi:MAG: hypothetical protein WDO18_02395 [Acidobacteriota bacterium]